MTDLLSIYCVIYPFLLGQIRKICKAFSLTIYGYGNAKGFDL
ncbi:MAG: hypothetical protein Alpg2KO_33620 [Alphaproteobacteria bacterium]